MLRILKAFAWLRWRVLLNSLERTGGRDRLGRLSVATDSLAPLLLAVVMAPSALALASLGGYAGWSLAIAGEHPSFQAVRFLLGAACVLALLAPIVLPSGERTNAVRLELLPISRPTLYVAHALATAAHPLLLLLAAILVSVPAGLAAGRQPAAALLSLTAGAIFLAVLAGVLSAVTAAAELLLRNRRRGEWVTLLLFLLLPVIGVTVGLLDGRRDARQRPSVEREAPGPLTIDRRAMALLPSEPYVRVVRASAESRYLAALGPLVVLAAASGLVHGAAYALFTRVLGSGGVSTSRGAVHAGSLARVRRMPGLSMAASAVALAHVRMALRTPRGRFTLLSPLGVFIPLAFMLVRHPAGIDLGFLRLQSGIGIAALTSFTALLAVLPFAMNQFAVDRGGLTLALLAPLETRALLAGKAAGNALVAAIPATACFAAALALFPAGDPALWLSVPLALAATYLLAAPVAAALSIVLPRRVDLNSIGRGSNAHGAAAFLGTLTCGAAGAASLLPVLAATAVLERPRLAPLLLLGWIAVCAATSHLLVRPIAVLFERRREDLSLLG